MRLLKFQGAIAKKTRTTKPTGNPTIHLNPSVIVEVGELPPAKIPDDLKTFIKTKDNIYHSTDSLEDILKELETL